MLGLGDDDAENLNDVENKPNESDAEDTLPLGDFDVNVIADLGKNYFCIINSVCRRLYFFQQKLITR